PGARLRNASEKRGRGCAAEFEADRGPTAWCHPDLAFAPGPQRNTSRADATATKCACFHDGNDRGNRQRLIAQLSQRDDAPPRGDRRDVLSAFYATRHRPGSRVIASLYDAAADHA